MSIVAAAGQVVALWRFAITRFSVLGELTGSPGFTDSRRMNVKLAMPMTVDEISIRAVSRGKMNDTGA